MTQQIAGESGGSSWASAGAAARRASPRRALALGTVVLVSLAMASCTAQPSFDRAAAEKHAEAFMDQRVAEASTLGGGTISVSADDPPQDGPAFTSHFDDPARVDAVHAVCFGAGAVRVSVALDQPSGSEGREVELACTSGASVDLGESVASGSEIQAAQFGAKVVRGPGGVVVITMTGADETGSGRSVPSTTASPN